MEIYHIIFQNHLILKRLEKEYNFPIISMNKNISNYKLCLKNIIKIIFYS